MAKSPIFQARHYRHIAQTLHELGLNDGQHWYIVEKFISELKSDNSNFNPERFEYAVTHGVNQHARQKRAPKRPSSLGRAMKHFAPGGLCNDKA